LYEAGIGENRAALIGNGELMRMRIERENLSMRAGAVVEAKFTKQWVAGRSGIVKLPDGSEALLQPLPKGLSEGAPVRVAIVREAIQERHGQYKRAKAKPAADDLDLNDGATLLEEILSSGLSVKELHPHEVDQLGEYGWHEVLEQAETGRVEFDGGCLLMDSTSAMTVIDVDGPLLPVELAKRAANEIALALNRLDISGNIGVDFPTLDMKSDRSAVGQIFDDNMIGDCERTAINGFGFMQIVSRKIRPSILEIVQANRVTNLALQLLRQAERDRGTGAMRLSVHPAIANKLNAGLIDELGRRTGRTVTVEEIGKLPLDGGQIGAI
jgi:ribonuclease G